MPTIKQLLEKELSAVVEKGYQEACYYFKVVPYRQVIFKGFYSKAIYQQILNNEEILTNLGADTTLRKRIFAEELEDLVLAKSGLALPAKWETWIILNPYYIELGFSENLVLDLVKIVAHETAHAVIFNWDIYWGHVAPHKEITKYLQNYYWKQNIDWKKIFKAPK